MRVAVLCPTRDNPSGLSRLAESVMATSSGRATVVAYVDHDNQHRYSEVSHPGLEMVVGIPRLPAHAINELCRELPGFDCYVNAVDDAEFETPDWDLFVEQGLAGFPGAIGVVAAHHNGVDAVNFAAVSRRWIETLGWMACPDVAHFCWDTAVELLGEATSIRYATEHEFHVYHLRPENSRRVERFVPDCVQFLGWCISRRKDCIAKLRTASRRND